MRIGSLFSGIGGLELGLEWSGIGRTVWQVEQCPQCIKILEKHWPKAERYKDVKTVGRHNLEPVDLICGGFPCQDVSTAGKGAGLGGSRSGLWFEFIRIVEEIRPEWVIVENVAGGAKRWVDPVSMGLEQQGYATLPIPLSAQDVGAPHLRRRVFIIAHTQRKQLWDKQRRRGRKSGEREAEPKHNGEAGNVADTYSSRKLQSQGGEQEEWGRSSNESSHVPNSHCKQTERIAISRCKHSYWSAEPVVGRVANGIPNRMDRLRKLGNAVVPQCSQVIGEFIKQLHTDSAGGEEEDKWIVK